jgi:hypothetical protein
MMTCEENTTLAYPWKLAQIFSTKGHEFMTQRVEKGVMNVPIFVPKFNTPVHNISS